MSRQEAPLLVDPLVTLDADPGTPVEPVRARRYRHPVLGERPVVRLVGETAAPGEDGTLAFLGFEPPVASEPLARAPRRGLGFPQWVLLNDPARAGEALAVVKDMEQAAQLARTKPGHAKDLYEMLSRRLPHAHLPSFWEQAGRAFLATDRRRHAATMFEKAREAERVYGLATGAADRREVFLEFARAGALPAKSLARSVTELRRRHSPEDAYEAFLELALGRARGGLPPWTDLSEQARRLALHAGRDPAAEEERLLERLLVLPATRWASAGFWRHGRVPLIRMARASAAVRGTLLNLLPEPDHEGDFDGWWLDVLDESGALDALILPADQVPPESAPSRGAGGWLSRFLERPQRPWWRRRPPPPQFFALVARMAPRLRADGRPVVLATGAWSRSHTLDANVIDVFAEHGIPLADLPPDASIDLHEWLQSGAHGGVRRSLEHMAADRRFRPLLTAAIPRLLDYAQRPADVLLVSPALEGLVRRWLEDRAAAVDQGGLVQAARSLGELARSTDPQMLGRYPRAHAALARARLAVPLARTLRGGLVDELGWPALEAAVAELGAAGPSLRSSASWPVLVVQSPMRAVAVGPGGRVAEHDLRLTNPSRHHQAWVVYAGGQFLVCWRDHQRGRQVAYWSGAPGEIFPLAEPPFGRGGPAHGFSFLLPDGGRITGGRALYPGDREQPGDAAHLLWDGGSFWTVEWERERFVARELDPRTGERGRQALPSFLEDRAEPGETLLVELCSLAPLPTGLEGTPLGHSGGALGFRVATVQRRSGPVVRVEGIDGRRLEAHPRSPAQPFALIKLPGSARPRLLGDFWRVELWDPSLSGPLGEIEVGHAGSNRWAASGLPAAGTPLGVPPAFWHCLRGRDEPGSRALREVDGEAAAELLQAGLEDLEGFETRPPEQLPRTAAAIERVLPAVSHPRLLLGLLGTVATAARLERRREQLGGDVPAQRRTRLPRRPAPPAPTQFEGPPLDEEALLPALADLGGGRSEHLILSGPPLGDQLRRLGRFFAGEADADAVMPVLRAPALAWAALLGRIGAVAFRALSPVVSQRERDALLDLIELWACLPFAADPGSFRVGVALGGAGTAGRSERGAWVVLADGVARMFAGGFRNGGTLIERRGGDGDGTALPAQVEVAEARRVEAGWGTPAQLTAFVKLARGRQLPLPDPAVPEALATRTGLTRAEATLLWAGLPNLDTWHSDFLGPELRRVLRLKVAEATAARATLRRASPAQRLQLLDAAMPDDPAELWRPLGASPDDGASPVARLAAAWTGLFGRHARPPEDALVEAAALGLPTPAGELLAILLDPAAAPALAHDRDWVLAVREHGGGELTAGDVGAEPMSQLIIDLAVAVPWAFASRPVGDPLRARLPELLALALDRLRHPGLLLAAGWRDVGESHETAAKLFGPAPYEVKGGVALAGSADDGLTVAVPYGSWSLGLFFRPALLGDDARSTLLRAQARAGWHGDTVAAVGLLRSPGYGAMAERVRATPVPDGGFEANPAQSAPELVRATAGALAVGDQAAALYLQLLTLPDPTDQNVRRWNGWTRARHRRAAAELLGAGLVVEAKRERSRRGLFLPGEWVKATAPNLPLEAWKLPLYALERDPTTGRPPGPLARFLPLVPLHELFAVAWARVEAGDRPEGGAG
jgi:hypothetical protein